MKYLIGIFKYFVVKLILFIQLIKYKFFKKPFSRNKIELLKHKLNFYSYNLKNRKPLKSNFIFSIDKNINSDIFKINISKFLGYDGAYIYEGKAALLKSAIEIYKNPKIYWKESYLYSFYKNFQPKNMGELYDLNKDNNLYHISSYMDFKPWIDKLPLTKKSKGIFGPIDENEIKHRILRLKNIFINIEKFGYLSTETDIVKGYLLILDNDYRFLITSGHHRIAVLKTINYFNKEMHKNILVKFDNKRANKNIVDIRKIQSWPAIRSSYCSQEDALDFVTKYCFG